MPPQCEDVYGISPEKKKIHLNESENRGILQQMN